MEESNLPANNNNLHDPQKEKFAQGWWTTFLVKNVNVNYADEAITVFGLPAHFNGRFLFTFEGHGPPPTDALTVKIIDRITKTQHLLSDGGFQLIDGNGFYVYPTNSSDGDFVVSGTWSIDSLLYAPHKKFNSIVKGVRGQTLLSLTEKTLIMLSYSNSDNSTKGHISLDIDGKRVTDIRGNTVAMQNRNSILVYGKEVKVHTTSPAVDHFLHTIVVQVADQSFSEKYLASLENVSGKQ